MNVRLCSLLVLITTIFGEPTDSDNSLSKADTASNQVTTTTPPPPKSEQSRPATAPPIKGEVIENAAIMGCAWPYDYAARFTFCLNKAGLEVDNTQTGERKVQYGVLDHGILDTLMSSCTNATLAECVRQADGGAVAEFVARWHDSVLNYTTFERCLQSNTEAMNRLCGSDARVSKVVSGAAGLQLNLINILVRLAHPTVYNVTWECSTAIASAVHVTAALYLKSQHYRDNAVMCWNAARSKEQCNSECSAFAAQLNCLHSACSTVPVSALQQLGIWQWYFLDTVNARERCNINDDKCTVTDDGTSVHHDDVGFYSLFDAATLKKRFGLVKDQLEHTFHIPFARIALIIVGILSTFCGLCILLCAWYYGVWGRRRRVTRYSRLLDERISTGGLEGKSLTHTIDDEIDD